MINSIIVFSIFIFVISFVMIFIYWYCTRYNDGIAGFHFDDKKNKKLQKEFRSIFKIGFLLWVLSVIQFMFLPFMFHKFNFINLVNETDSLNEELKLGIEAIPFTNSFLDFCKNIAEKVEEKANSVIFAIIIIVLGIVLIITFVFIFLILLKIRDLKANNEINDSRRHLFEYNDENLKN